MTRICAASWVRLALALAAASFVSAAPARARAADPVTAPPSPDARACADAFEDGQRARRDGAFVRARRLLLVCSREPCSDALRPTCTRWLAEIEQRIPSVVVSLRSASGEDVRDARVLVDGIVVAEQLDGRAVELDPGERVLRVESARATIEKRVVIAEGEKARGLPLRLEASPSAPDTSAPSSARAPRGRSVSLGTYVFGGLAVASLGVTAGFWMSGESGYSDMERCRPGCSPELVSTTRTQLVVGDVALLVALLSTGAGVISWLAR